MTVGKMQTKEDYVSSKTKLIISTIGVAVSAALVYLAGQLPDIAGILTAADGLVVAVVAYINTLKTK